MDVCYWFLETQLLLCGVKSEHSTNVVYHMMWKIMVKAMSYWYVLNMVQLSGKQSYPFQIVK